MPQTPGYGGVAHRGAGCNELHACVLPPVVVGPTVECTACARSKEEEEEEEEEEVSSSWPGFRPPAHYIILSGQMQSFVQHSMVVQSQC
jgi:hypothetical protein